jgi:hypothetical protein
MKMPLFQANLVNKENSYNSVLPIHDLEVRFFDKSIEEAEMTINVISMRIFPELVLDSVFEVGFTGSDPTVA